MTSSANHPARGAQIEVIAAAFLFSLSVPVGKLLLARVDPLALSGILYLSAGAFCGILVLLDTHRRYWGISRRTGPSIPPGPSRPPGSPPPDGPSILPGPSPSPVPPDPLRASEWITLAAAVTAGGVLAPLALFVGLRLVAAHVAGLLLNFETLFTIALGVLLSGEHLGRRGWMGAAGIVGGAALLSWGPATEGATDWRGVLLVIAACALWGLDNNLTQRISIRDARMIVAVKGLAGGATSLILALALGRLGQWTAFGLLAAIALGAASFGASIALFVRGLRRIGVVQSGTLFALAPGLAAVLSWAILGDALAAARIVAFCVMSLGALLLMSESHAHPHVHEAMEHFHAHEHDVHHDHEHEDIDVRATPHAHTHRHDRLAHDHPHAHDTHHRHRKDPRLKPP